VADIKIRNLPDWILNWHRLAAERKGVSLEEHLRRALLDDAMEDRRRLVEKLDRLRAEIQAETGELPDSAPLIREARQEMETQFDVRRRRRRRAGVARSID